MGFHVYNEEGRGLPIGSKGKLMDNAPRANDFLRREPRQGWSDPSA
jgi:hypothetical protein